MTELYRISIQELSADLREEIDSPTDEWTAWEHVIMRDDGFIDGNRRYHIVHHAEWRRGGVVLVGSGSSGLTAWTDASTPDEVLTRYLADDMRN